MIPNIRYMHICAVHTSLCVLHSNYHIHTYVRTYNLHTNVYRCCIAQSYGRKVVTLMHTFAQVHSLADFIGILWVNTHVYSHIFSFLILKFLLYLCFCFFKLLMYVWEQDRRYL